MPSIKEFPEIKDEDQREYYVKRMKSLFEHPGWAGYQEAITQEIETCTRTLIYMQPDMSSDSVTLLSEIRSLQRTIGVYIWIRDTLPALLTAEKEESHPDKEPEGQYADSHGEGVELAGQEAYLPED